MRAFVLDGPRRGRVADVEPPVASPGQVVIDVERVGVCGTDVEFYTGEMEYLHAGHAAYPLRLGHEWSGTVASVGSEDDGGWIGRRVTGDTMLGCGQCARCRRGRQHVCENRYEVGIRGGWHGALAEQVLMPTTALRGLPDTVDATAGALVEPGGNALRAVQGAALREGDRVLILGPGTIGLLTALFARAAGAEVHLMGQTDASLVFARTLGFERAVREADLPDLPFDAVVDCSNAARLPAFALDRVEPGGRVVYIGLAGSPSQIDTRALVLGDVTAVGVLSASPGLDQTIAQYASGAVDPSALVAATVRLDAVAHVLAGWRPDEAGSGPKIHVDPRPEPVRKTPISGSTEMNVPVITSP